MYEPNALRLIHDRLQHDQRLRILPFGSISTIRKLRLNNKSVKDRLILRQYQHQNKSNSANLIRIKKNRFKLDARIIFATCNIQSMRYKELQVSQLISNYSLDFLVLTETWLNSKHDLWKDTTILNKDQLRLHTANQKQGKRWWISTNQQKAIPLQIDT